MNKWCFLFFISFFLSCALTSRSIDLQPFITMKRTPCYGQCPHYVISVYESGLIVYKGMRFVQNIGCFKSHINSNQINFIKLLLDEIQFFDLEEEYITQVTDIPSVITQVSINNHTHRVTDRLHAPQKLKNLYKELDLLVDSIVSWEECSNLY